MSEEPPIERDTSGRFVKPEGQTAAVEEDDAMHPMAKLLFGWVEAKSTPGILLGAVLLLALGLIAADLLVDRHEYIEFANATGFFGFWGFGAFALAVISGWPLGRLLRRSEDYYGEGDDTPKVHPSEDDA
ncbi:MAG: hypothetical protein AAF216_02715 [Pseudomonadota bacterium]